MSSENNYSRLDRVLHRLAFSSAAVQQTAADIEKAMYGRSFGGIRVERPVFVTSLPRAGTTLVLDMLTKVSPVASHSYRDMPFVMAPMLWDSLSKAFRKPTEMKERAHGDGMLVGFDSPEAFEEVLWRVSFPRKFGPDRIDLWSETEPVAEFRTQFVEHVQKIIALRSTGGEPRRYVSKNNANIARLRLLRRLFPDAEIVVPIRHPVAHARSLLRQHVRFLSLHDSDPFSVRYMEDIGHLEFGRLHRPIFFAGMDEVMARYRPDQLDYWIAYWVRAFRHILEHADVVRFVSYERLCVRGAEGLREIAERIGLSYDPSPAESTEFHEAREHKTMADAVDQELLREAEALHAELLALSVL
jgi:hypothetical protein